jgi:S1-C subfamily serine protease
MSRYDSQPHYSPWLALLVPALFVLLLLGLIVWFFWPALTPERSGIDPSAAPRPVTPRGELAEDEKSTIALFKKASPSVVHITTLVERRDRFTTDLRQIPQGTGSGFIWDQDGHVVTNYHVIQNADAAQVTLADQSTWRAKLVGSYPDRDLAVLLIEAPKELLVPILVGSSHDLQVGQKAFAIGNPFGLDQSLTTGVISALGREIESVTRRPIRDMIQTDAAINPGNSGGPLLDSAGRLIGVNTAIYSPSGTSAGIGFAIPVDEVGRVVPQLIRHGKVIRPDLAVQFAPDQIVRQNGLKGALILNVQPGGCAAKAGLQPTRRERGGTRLGDRIVALDGQKVDSANQLLDLLEKKEVGTTVEVTVVREGKERNVTVTLEAAP